MDWLPQEGISPVFKEHSKRHTCRVGRVLKCNGQDFLARLMIFGGVELVHLVRPGVLERFMHI